jgi:hypothetical protein
VGTGLALAACAGGAPQDVTPAIAPTLGAHAVYERFVEAAGGRTAMQQYESSKATGKFSLPAQGINGDLEVSAMAPNKLAIRVNIPGIGIIRTGFNGEVGWSINPAVGPMVLDGIMLEQLRQQADFLGPLNMEAYVDTAEVVAEETFDGRLCQKVRLVTTWGEEYFEFYDVATGLLAGNIRTQESPMGAIEATTVVSDYRDFGGLLVPTKTVQQVMGMEQIFTISDVTYDMVDPAVFALPKEIQALVEQP